jgi:hypothetical protein
MSTASATSNLEFGAAGEPTMFDSLARLVPDELQTEYYRVLAHTRTLSPDDEMLRILEAMGILALLTRHTPKDIAEEREHFQELLECHRQFLEEAQRKMLGYVRGLESRISSLPSEIEAGLDPKGIAKLLGESLRQHFLLSGVPETVAALQAAAGGMAGAQQKLTRALMELTDYRGGVVAQVQSANSRLLDSLEYRAGKLDSLVHEFKSDLLRIWMPIVICAALLSGLFLGMVLQSHRDSDSAARTAPTPAVQSTPTNRAQEILTTDPTIRKKPLQSRVASIPNNPP